MRNLQSTRIPVLQPEQIHEGRAAAAALAQGEKVSKLQRAAYNEGKWEYLAIERVAERKKKLAKSR